MDPPPGAYIPVHSGNELEQSLRAGNSSIQYLELATRSVFRIIQGLNPATGTHAIIKCNGHTIDMTASEEYDAAPGTTLDFFGCKIHVAHSGPLAEMTSYSQSHVFGVCQVPTPSCYHLRTGVLLVLCLPLLTAFPPEHSNSARSIGRDAMPEYHIHTRVGVWS